MKIATPHIIPKPTKLRRTAGALRLADCLELLLPRKLGESGLEVARQVTTEIDLVSGSRLTPTDTITTRGMPYVELRMLKLASPEHYRLTIRSAGIELIGGGAAGIELIGGGAPGLYYGAQTLIQIIDQAVDGCVPHLQIEDGPDYPARGVYHDISRGKVPTRSTLLALVEKVAHYKINQFQLYIEHTYSFANHADIWAGSDPLTADDILAIDEHAARHHVELVPSLSCFGHFYTGLVSPRKQHLNELPVDASTFPFSWWDRMAHYTLDCRNPESLELVREMILELRPLFRTKLFNICCDETFDLGKGRNAEYAKQHGNGKLYLDFLKKLFKIVREAGATPMFWGDIVGNHPELVSKVSRRSIALDWDYSTALRDTKSRHFKKAQIPFYVCPGVSSWDRWINDLDAATANITKFARRGKRDGAIGLLNTDWGDRGHVNCLGNSYHGLLLGAGVAWNTKGTHADEFDNAFARLEFGDASGQASALMREAAREALVSWREFTLWLDPSPHPRTDWIDEMTGLPKKLLNVDPRKAFAAANRLEKIRARFGRLITEGSMQDPIARDEFLFGCRAQAVSNRLGAWLVCLAKKKVLPKGAPSALEVADQLRHLEAEFSPIWHARNRPSEYWRIKTTLLELARRLEIRALQGVWIRTERAKL